MSTDSLAQQHTQELRNKVALAEGEELFRKFDNDCQADAARIALEESKEATAIYCHDPKPGIRQHLLAASEIAINSIRDANTFVLDRAEDTIHNATLATANAVADTKNLAAQGWDKTKETAVAVKDTTIEASATAWDKTKEAAAATKDVTLSAAQAAGDAVANTAAAAWDKTKDGAELIKEKTAAAAAATKDTTLHAAHVAGDAITSTASTAWEATKDTAAVINDAANGNVHRNADELVAADREAASARIDLESRLDNERNIQHLPMSELPLAAKLKYTAVAAGDAILNTAGQLVDETKEIVVHPRATADAIADTAAAAWHGAKTEAELVQEKTVAAAAATKDTTLHAAHVAVDAITSTAGTAWEAIKDTATAIKDAANGNVHRNADELVAADHDAAAARAELEARLDRDRAIQSLPIDELPLAAKLKYTTVAAGDAILNAAGQLVDATKDAAAAVSRTLRHTEAASEDKAILHSFSGRFDTATPVVSHSNA